MMGFGLKGDSLPPTTGFPRCDLVLQHIPCHRTPCSNNLPVLLLSKVQQQPPIIGTRVKTCKNQVARAHFGNKIGFLSLSPRSLPDRGIQY